MRCTKCLCKCRFCVAGISNRVQQECSRQPLHLTFLLRSHDPGTEKSDKTCSCRFQQQNSQMVATMWLQLVTKGVRRMARKEKSPPPPLKLPHPPIPPKKTTLCQKNLFFLFWFVTVLEPRAQTHKSQAKSRESQCELKKKLKEGNWGRDFKMVVCLSLKEQNKPTNHALLGQEIVRLVA